MPHTMPTTVALACMALSLAACSRADHQDPAPAESLKPLPSAQPQPPAPAPEASASQAVIEGDECGASKLSRYLNQLPAADTLAQIGAAVGHDRIRTIRPGDVVTMDMRPDRLNVEIGEDGRIKLFRCG